ncbi:cytochrome c oxidase assembly factor 7 homolog [Cephus cinctus]|uniref:Cytochrome c oxidase assembly factor 7 homolog n=1 Tax=Cephus cinctus TaxID=211228 RepID=A0AAJ7FJ24_CEPCN|nr:cytochrome c oxidase assembly factor 7 homolog [Cephus cinctus]
MGTDFKSEKEVQDYLKNLYIEYKFGCYHDKNAETCHLLGDYEESIKKDDAKAGEVYKMNCDTYNYGKSCVRYGSYSFLGKGCKEDRLTGYKYFKKACETDNPEGCTNAGIMAVSNEDFDEKDRSTQVNNGVAMLKKAAEVFNNEKACFYLSGIYIRGIEGHLEKNLKEAYKYSTKACELGNPYACANVAQMYTRGEGVDKNADEAASYKQRALELHKEIKHGKRSVEFQQGL